MDQWRHDYRGNAFVGGIRKFSHGDKKKKEGRSTDRMRTNSESGLKGDCLLQSLMTQFRPCSLCHGDTSIHKLLPCSYCGKDSAGAGRRHLQTWDTNVYTKITHQTKTQTQINKHYHTNKTKKKGDKKKKKQTQGSLQHKPPYKTVKNKMGGGGGGKPSVGPLHSPLDPAAVSHATVLCVWFACTITMPLS